MSLKEQLKEMKAQQEEDIKLLDEGTEVEEPKPTELPDDKPKDEPVEEPAEAPEEPVEEPKKTPADYARERRSKAAAATKLQDELNAANARAAAAEARANELSRPKDEDAEPSKTDNREAWLEWKDRQIDKKASVAQETAQKAIAWQKKQEEIETSKSNKQAAERELNTYEQQVRQKATDYDDVKTFYVNMLAASFKNIVPDITHEHLVEVVSDRFMRRASKLLNDGYENPVEIMYQEAKALRDQSGYKAETKEIKPDLKKLSDNKKRSVGMVGARGGEGEGEITASYAGSKMTNREWVKLPAAQRKRILQSTGE